jgi:Kef-type K+ transport system membrane component KefB
MLGLISPHLQHTLFPPTAEQKGMLDAVSQLGILLLLLLTGMETDLRLVRRVGRSAMAVAAAGVALPFMCGFALGALLPDSLLPHAQSRFVTALFLATALSISSIKIVAVVVREMNFMRRDIGQIIVASAILEDTAGWVIIAISFGLASSGTMDHAGVLIGESPILTRHIEEQLRGLIAALFMPVFFGLSGLSADLTILKDPELLLLAIGLIIIASAGKFAGAFVGGKLGRLIGRGAAYTLIVIYPRFYLLTNFCGGTAFTPFQHLNVLANPAYALDKPPLEILKVSVDEIGRAAGMAVAPERSRPQ